MTGRELIENIKKNGWEDAEIWIGVQGYINKVSEIAPMFPRLNNTNEVMICDDCATPRDEYFWKVFYGSYLDLIPECDADVLFHDGDRSFLICPCDGTEHYISDNCTDEEWEEIKESGCLFALEKEE